MFSEAIASRTFNQNHPQTDMKTTTASTTPVSPGEVAILVEAAGRQQKVVVSRSPFTIGRLTDCDVVIADARVSRVHASLLSERGEYFIVDGGSLHGTFVN